ASAIRPDESTRIEEKIHASSNVWLEFFQRRIKIGCGRHGMRMQWRNAAGNGLRADGMRRRLAHAFAGPFINRFVGRLRRLSDQSLQIIIQLNDQRAHWPKSTVLSAWIQLCLTSGD